MGKKFEKFALRNEKGIFLTNLDFTFLLNERPILF